MRKRIVGPNRNVLKDTVNVKTVMQSYQTVKQKSVKRTVIVLQKRSVKIMNVNVNQEPILLIA
jgi:hypothetical protein